MKTLIALFAASALVLAGCGGTELDNKKLEETLPHDLRTVVPSKIVSADCPSGIEVEKGKKFNCRLVLANGKKGTVELKLTNENADYEYLGFSLKK